jgi:hypothetical protein
MSRNISFQIIIAKSWKLGTRLAKEVLHVIEAAAVLRLA